MALPKAKVKERLKVKFPGVDLSNKRVDAIADKLILPEDSDDETIDGRLVELNDIFSFAELAKNDDRQRSIEAEKKRKEKTDNQDSDSETQESKTPETDIAKMFAELLAPITQELASIKAGKTTDTRKSQLESILKDTPDKFKARELKAFERMKFDTDEDFETYKTELIEDAKDSLQQQSNEGLGGFGVPIAPKGGNSKQASKEEVAELSKNILR